MELAHWADHTETRLGLTKRAPVPGAEGTQVLTKRSAPLRFCCCFVPPPAGLSTPPLERASRLAQKRLAAGTGL